jgi:hypothetical protein
VVRSPAALRPGDRLVTTVAEGEVRSTVDDGAVDDGVQDVGVQDVGVQDGAG